MENEPRAPSDSANRSFPAGGERFIYVMPEEAIRAFAEDEMTLSALWTIVWRGKWWIIGITAAFAIVSVVHALTATEWYRAEVLLAPAEQRTSQPLSGTLGGLASLAGVSVGGGDAVEALAVLRSRDFAAEFINDLDLLPVFFAEADGNSESGEHEAYDIRDGVKYFNDNIRTVTEDRDTRLVTLAIEWTDPTLAAEWANVLAERLNDRMRLRALEEAETNVNYLQLELGKTSMLMLQQSIGRLMETELQKLMLARGNEEFAFRVIDRAQVPKMRSRPRRTLMVVLSMFVGGMVAVLFVLLREAISAERKENRAPGIRKPV
jgi:uncharacterized protein involved in exopolysaccharide biosynthesis